MTTLHRSHRVRFRVCAAIAVSELIGVACGSDDNEASPTTTPDPAATSAAASTPDTTDAAGTSGIATDAFPVTIEHAFGTTVVPSEPQRVVVVGLNEADYLYSLGVAPVGVHEWWGGYHYATGPWADATRIEVGAEPDVLEGFDINPEWVAELEPDLIVATYHDVDRTMYDTLSKIAPVVAASADHEAWATPWREQLRLIATAVGRTERAEEVITGVDDTIEEIKAAHPDIAGATFETGLLEDGSLTAYSSDDIGNQMLAELGMSVPASFDDLADGVFISLSTEQFEILDQLDTFIWMDAEGLAETQVAQIPTYTATQLHTEGRSVFPSHDMVLAMSFNTPLSIPYFLEELAPMLEAALDGDPSTTAAG
jgi:iron complex transport system substrate-binding protein